MPHEHPLHTDVVVQCWCCRSLQPFRFRAASDPVVCAHCTGHLGPEKAEQRDTDHVALWLGLWSEEHDARLAAASRSVAAADAAATRIAQLETQLEDLMARVADGFASAPDAAVREHLQSEIVRRAERNTELVRRLSDRLSVELWRLDVLHHDDPSKPGFCSCGRPLAQCPESRILDGERRAIRDWEARNLALKAQGKRHALPDDHPGLSG
jgi:PAS domain-containing protein